MPVNGCKILLVEPDPEILEIIVASLVRRFNAQITCVSNAESCLDTELTDPHDLVISELDLEDSDGVQLARHLFALGHRPVILLADSIGGDEAIEALRTGVRDLFCKPFDMEDLLDAAQRLITGYQLRRQHAAKYKRMRDLVRHVIRERRDINRRVELVCRDLVGAHRRLVHRVLATEESGADSSA